MRSPLLLCVALAMLTVSSGLRADERESLNRTFDAAAAAGQLNVESNLMVLDAAVAWYYKRGRALDKRTLELLGNEKLRLAVAWNPKKTIAACDAEEAVLLKTAELETAKQRLLSAAIPEATATAKLSMLAREASELARKRDNAFFSIKPLFERKLWYGLRTPPPEIILRDATDVARFGKHIRTGFCAAFTVDLALRMTRIAGAGFGSSGTASQVPLSQLVGHPPVVTAGPQLKTKRLGFSVTEASPGDHHEPAGLGAGHQPAR